MMKKEYVQRWADGLDDVCPFCGNPEFDREGEDDGWDEAGHWTAWEWRCCSCNKVWRSVWYLHDVELYED